MLPHHIIIAVAILTIDLGHTLGRPSPVAVGAALFTGRIDLGRVTFHLDSHILAASEPSSSLLAWLDAKLYDEQATVTGYDLAGISAVLGVLPDANWSPALRILGDCGHQPVIDTALHDAEGRIIPFADAALTAGIPAAPSDQTLDFNAWMTSRRTRLAERLESDAIGCWRLAMARIAERSALGRRVDAAIGLHLADWLRRHAGQASSLHLDSLARPRG